MRLFILISLSFLGITGSPVCVHQMNTRTVQSEGFVTIPCSYSDPGKPEEDVRVIWGTTLGEYCSSEQDIIISPSGNVTEKYEGQLYREKDPNRNRTEYIKITGLEHTDGSRFCCLLIDIRYNSIFKDSRQGTLLQFPDTEYITQMDEVMAVSGEEGTIPCYYSKDTSDITKITWYYADKERHYCTEIPIHEWRNAHQYGRYSLVNFSQDVSLRIRNIHKTDQRSYCCVISTTSASTRLTSIQFTRLVVAEYPSSFDLPTNEIPVQEGRSVNLSCSYTLPTGRNTERDVVRVNVYWRVGNVTGPYAYHPYQEMVHSTYRHRTSITGMTNLMINDVKKADNTLFHCFVVVKRCSGDYQYEHEIIYGGGTRLIINDDMVDHTTNGGNGSAEDRRLSFQDLIIIVVSSVTIMIILIAILIILKVKGVICKKKTNFSEQQMDSIQAAGDVTSEEAPYCEISKKPEDVLEASTDQTKKTEMESGQMEDGEEGNLLYAKLNQTKLKEKRPAESPKPNEEVVYAAVVNTTPN